MGTNFYVRGFRHSDDPEHHLGKRSAAGRYCWDCRVTLCMGGEEAIHYGRSEWYDECPKCGAKPNQEPLEESSAGRELGFNKSKPVGKTGVKTCASFSWAMSRAQYDTFLETYKKPCCNACDRPFEDTEKIIEDEYGRTYTREEFNEILAECPVRYWNHVGQYFS